MTSKSQQDKITINERDGDVPVVLRPENNDLFGRTARQVISACQLGISVELWLNELTAMLTKVSRWSAERSQAIRACFCAPGGTRTILFFVPVIGRFDFDLADQLTALNAELVKEFNVGMVEVRQVPWEELDRFLNPDSAKLVYGEQPESHPAVDA